MRTICGSHSYLRWHRSCWDIFDNYSRDFLLHGQVQLNRAHFLNFVIRNLISNAFRLYSRQRRKDWRLWRRKSKASYSSKVSLLSLSSCALSLIKGIFMPPSLSSIFGKKKVDPHPSLDDYFSQNECLLYEVQSGCARLA